MARLCWQTGIDVAGNGHSALARDGDPALRSLALEILGSAPARWWPPVDVELRRRWTVAPFWSQSLPAELAAGPLTPPPTALLGLVQHLTDGERYWFGHTLAGDPRWAEVDFAMLVAADREPEEVIAGYRAATAESDAHIRSAGDPDARTAEPVAGAARSLRWVLAHMTGETVRHAGHADILRELIDGTTGR
jgi:hypothetical protein